MAENLQNGCADPPPPAPPSWSNGQLEAEHEEEPVQEAVDTTRQEETALAEHFEPDADEFQSESVHVVEDPLPSPMKVGCFTTFVFTRSGLQVESRSLFSPSQKTFISWATVSKVQSNWSCFSGEIMLTLTTGETRSFACGRISTMVRATSAIQNIGVVRHGHRSQQPLFAREAAALIRHPQVGVTADGLLVLRRTGMCRRSSTFLPWSAITLTGLSSSRRRVTVHAKLSQERKRDRFDEEEEAAEAGVEKTDSKDCSESDVAIISIAGKQDESEALHEELKRRLTGESGEICELTGEASNARLSKAGVSISRNTRRFGFRGVEEYFLPWDAVVSISWASPGRCSSAQLQVTDRCGLGIGLKGYKLEDFAAFRLALKRDAASSSQSEGPATMSRGIWRSQGVAMAEDGIVLLERTCFREVRRYIPWGRVDGLEIDVGCCGGRATVLLETGERLEAGSSLLGKSWLWKFSDEVEKTKYGQLPAESKDVLIFNRKRNPRLNCELSNSNLKLVLGRRVREWDLDRIQSCRTSRDYLQGQGLLIEVIGNHRKEVLAVPVNKGSLSAEELAQQICSRARLRKNNLATCSCRY